MRIETTFQNFILLTFTAILFFGFFHYFDITDEAYHLYHNQFGLRTYNTIMTYQIVPHAIGYLFDHQAIGFRFLTFAVNTLLSLYIAKAVQSFLSNKSQLLIPFALLSSFNLYVFVTSFDYNVSATFSAYLWLGSILYLYAPTTSYKLLFICLLALGSVWAVLSKFTYGVPLFMLTPVIVMSVNLLLGQKWHFNLLTLVSTHSLVLGLTVALIHLLYPNFWEHYLSTFQAFLNMPGNASGLIDNLIYYFLSTGKYFATVLLAWLVFCYLSVHYFKRAYARHHYNSAQAILYGLLIGSTFYGFYNFIPFDPAQPVGHPGYALTKFWPAIVLIVWLTQWRFLLNTPRMLVFIMLSVGVTALTPMGTNTNYMNSVSLSAVPYGLLFALFMIHFHQCYPKLQVLTLNRTFIPTSFLCLALLIGTAVTHEKVLNYRRADTLNNQTHVLPAPNKLNYIKTTPEFAQTITQLQSQLNAVGFDKDQDRIFGYADIPGYLAALNIQSFAESWVITGYPNSSARACHYIQAEPNQPTRHVYILKSTPLTPEVDKCLSAKISSLPETQESSPIVAGFHYRALKNHTIKLSGPYVIKNQL